MPFATREAQLAYQRQWKAARRAAWFKDKECLRCGTKDTLENHHRDRTTKTASDVWSWSIERRDIELAKCDVLCKVCHREITSEQNKQDFSTPLQNKKHGTDNTYNRHHCRCELCREWKRKSRTIYPNG
jgi:hypothetical protein